MDRAEMSSHVYFKTSLRRPTCKSGPLRALSLNSSTRPRPADVRHGLSVSRLPGNVGIKRRN